MWAAETMPAAPVPHVLCVSHRTAPLVTRRAVLAPEMPTEQPGALRLRELPRALGTGNNGRHSVQLRGTSGEWRAARHCARCQGFSIHRSQSERRVSGAARAEARPRPGKPHCVTELGPPRPRAGGTQGPESCGPRLTSCRGALRHSWAAKGPVEWMCPGKGDTGQAQCPLILPSTGGPSEKHSPLGSETSSPESTVLEVESGRTVRGWPDGVRATATASLGPWTRVPGRRGSSTSFPQDSPEPRAGLNQLTGAPPLLCEALGTGAG